MLVALAVLTVKARAADSTDTWGDLGYTHPGPVVEEVPESISDDAPSLTLADASVTQTTSVTMTKSSEESSVKSEPIAAKPSKRITDINTVENTYGVMTEERQPISIYVSPFAGVASVIGNDTSDSTPKYAAGISAGALVSSNILLYGSYTYSLQDFSNPRLNAANGITLASSELFEMKQNSIEGGVRFYILGRDSRVRPFVGGGMGIAKSTLNYTAANQSILAQYSPLYGNEFSISQVNGLGELGAEIAITKSIVANASFKIRGVLSSSTSGDSQTTAVNYDTSKLDVGNSLSRSASFVLGAGLGVYF